MNTRIVMLLASTLMVLPLVLAGCGNKGPLVMRDAAPVEPADAVSEPLLTLPMDTATVADSETDSETGIDPAETEPADADNPDSPNDDGNG